MPSLLLLLFSFSPGFAAFRLCNANHSTCSLSCWLLSVNNNSWNSFTSFSSIISHFLELNNLSVQQASTSLLLPSCGIIVSNVALNFIYGCVCKFSTPLDKYQGAKLLDHIVTVFFFSYKKPSGCLPKCYLLHSHQQWMRILVAPNIWYPSVFWVWAVLMCCNYLVCISMWRLMWNIFHILTCHLYVFFSEVFAKVFEAILTWLVAVIVEF